MGEQSMEGSPRFLGVDCLFLLHLFRVSIDNSFLMVVIKINVDYIPPRGYVMVVSRHA